jgi:hypothetical protein
MEEKIEIYQSDTDYFKYNSEKAIEWLANQYEGSDRGFRHWYVLRERELKDEMSSGIEGSAYWTAYGRLQEIKRLQAQAKMMYEKTKK